MWRFKTQLFYLLLFKWTNNDQYIRVAVCARVFQIRHEIRVVDRAIHVTRPHLHDRVRATYGLSGLWPQAHDRLCRSISNHDSTRCNLCRCTLHFNPILLFHFHLDSIVNPFFKFLYQNPGLQHKSMYIVVSVHPNDKDCCDSGILS